MRTAAYQVMAKVPLEPLGFRVPFSLMYYLECDGHHLTGGSMESLESQFSKALKESGEDNPQGSSSFMGGGAMIDKDSSHYQGFYMTVLRTNLK